MCGIYKFRISNADTTYVNSPRRYALGIVFNPRSMNAAHILQNLGEVGTAWWDVKLSAQETQQMSSRPQL